MTDITNEELEAAIVELVRAERTGNAQPREYRADEQDGSGTGPGTESGRDASEDESD